MVDSSLTVCLLVSRLLRGKVCSCSGHSTAGQGSTGASVAWSRPATDREQHTTWAGLAYQISNAAFVCPYDAMMTSLMEENLENPNPGNFIDF